MFGFDPHFDSHFGFFVGYFMSQLSELDQGDGHDASIAARAVAAMNGGDDR